MPRPSKHQAQRGEKAGNGLPRVRRERKTGQPTHSVQENPVTKRKVRKSSERTGKQNRPSDGCGEGGRSGYEEEGGEEKIKLCQR